MMTEKSGGRGTKKARAKGSAEARTQRQEYIKRKARIMAKEEENFSQLLVLHDKDQWWKMFENSAIIFHYDIAKRIGVSSKLQPDTDYDFRSEKGVVNIRDIDLLDRKLKENKILPLDVRSEGRIYNLGKKYTLSDLEFMMKRKDMEWQKVNKIIVPKEIFPSVFALLRELNKKLYFSSQKMESYARESMAKPILERSNKMMRDYSLSSNGVGLNSSGFLDSVREDADWIISQMTVIAELKLMPVERIFQILHIATKIKREVDQHKPKVLDEDSQMRTVD